MEIKQEITKRKELQSLIINFIDNNDDTDDDFLLLSQFIKENNFSKNYADLRDLLYILSIIVENHYRFVNFFSKLTQIINYVLSDIQALFSDSELYNIFQRNLAYVLYLVNNKIIKLTEEIISIFQLFFTAHTNIKKEHNPYHSLFKYLYYKSINNTDEQEKIIKEIKNYFKMDFDTFKKLCQDGENELYVCKLIRQDSLNEFIRYINETRFELDSNIPFSYFETNPLLKNQTKVIEYAAFYGSIQIFKYLQMNKITFKSALLNYAVHGRNSEIIHLFEENVEQSKENKKSNVNMNSNRYFDALSESMKCHHNDIANYIEQNSIEMNEKMEKNIINASVQFFNYEFMPDDFNVLFPLPHKQMTNFNRNAYDAFYYFSKFTLPPSTKTIWDYCFCSFLKLKEIVIPSSVTSIGKNSFRKCESLEIVTFLEPSSLSSIGENAFTGCNSLKQITIPSSVTLIGESSFKECASLEQVTFLEPPSLSSIKKTAFAECISLKQIEIPSSVTLIDVYAFRNCSSLKEIKLPSSIDVIRKGLFENCSSIEHFDFPSDLKEIREYAFNNCLSLLEISIPKSVVSIGDFSFKKCLSLSKITFSFSETEIGKGSFYGCSSLKDVSLPSSLHIIKDYTFKQCTSLTEFNIPSSVSIIENYCFNKCTSLKQISLPSSLNSIGNDVFSECSSLEQITIPSSITNIKDFTFYKCKSLKKVTLPPSLKRFGAFSFYGCSSLEQINVPSSITEIGDFAFAKCPLLPKSALTEEATSNDEIQKYIQKTKDFYLNVLEYLESDEDINEHLMKLLQEKSEDEYDLIELLNLLSRISQNSRVCSIEKAEKIFSILQDQIRNKVSKSKIFQIFKDNKRFLLHLFENNIIDLDYSGANLLFNRKEQNIFIYNDEYKQMQFEFFKPEMMKIGYNPKITLSQNSSQTPSDFEEKRKIGQNDNEICRIIREDLIDEFIQYMDSKDEQMKYQDEFYVIPSSIYETSKFLSLRKVSYIEYAAFYGSMQIFNYLFTYEKQKQIHLANKFNGVSITREDEIDKIKKMRLWDFAIHGNQLEIIHVLEENEIVPEYGEKSIEIENVDLDYYYLSYNLKICFDCAIECHHNEIAKYLMNNYSLSTDYVSTIKYSHFLYLGGFYDKFENDTSTLLFYLCLRDLPKFAHVLLQSKNINLESFADSYCIKYKLIQRYVENSTKISDKTKIINASVQSNNEIIKFLVQGQKNLSFDNTSLCYAILNNNIEFVKIILSKDSFIDVNSKSYIETLLVEEFLNLISPLSLAIINKNIEIVKLLLEYPLTDVNMKYEPKFGRTTYRSALHLAISLKDIPVIKLLLNHPNIDVNTIGNFDETSYDFFNWSNANHFDSYFTPLHEAVELDSVEIVKLLLAHPKILVNENEVYDNYQNGGKDHFDRVKQTCLCRAIQKQNYEMVKLLLKHPNIDVNIVAVYRQNDTYNPYYDPNMVEEDEEGNEERNFVDNEDDEERKMIVKRSALQFAYAGKSQDILQLLLSRSDIKNKDVKEANDNLIKRFTRDLK